MKNVASPIKQSARIDRYEAAHLVAQAAEACDAANNHMYSRDNEYWLQSGDDPQFNQVMVHIGAISYDETACITDSFIEFDTIYISLNTGSVELPEGHEDCPNAFEHDCPCWFAHELADNYIKPALARTR